jgi:hypothetical protein
MSGNANSLLQPARGSLVAAGAALAFTFGFVVRNPGAILRHVAVPALLGCAALHLLIWGYCAQLTSYLDLPSEALAGRIMGIAAVSVLIMLLLHAIVVSRLAELVVGGGSGQPVFMGIRTDAWRIYAADLRLLFALGLFGVVVIGASALMFRFGVAPDIETAFNIAAWLLLFWLVVRGWFFLLPVSLQANGEGGLAMSWCLSRGHLATISAVMLPILLLMFFLLGGGEFLLRFTGVLSPMPARLTFMGAVGLYQRNLWPFVTLVSLVYLCGASLTTVARIRLHQQLVAGQILVPPSA